MLRRLPLVPENDKNGETNDNTKCLSHQLFSSHLLKQLEFSGSQLKGMTKQWVRDKSLRKHKGVGL